MWVGYHGYVNFAKAIQCARELAGRYDTRLGKCLLASAAGPERNLWLLAFEIINGPPDWCWSIAVDESREEAMMIACRDKPDPSLAPTIHRRWWFFGPTEMRRVDYDIIDDRVVTKFESSPLP